MVKSLDGKNFKDSISNGITLVDFYADWCTPCKIAKCFHPPYQSLPKISTVK